MEEENILSSKDLSREKEEENILKFLDSLDGYITLLDSLSSNLRKGWLDLASARHSMGTSRISSVLFDLKEKSAATTIQVSETGEESQSGVHYTLSKWGSLGDEKCALEEVEVKDLDNSTGSQLRHRGTSLLSEDAHAGNCNTAADTNQIQKERSKSLAVFGTLVSPKLRSTQMSFESALDVIIEIANVKSSMLSAYSQLQKRKIVSD